MNKIYNEFTYFFNKKVANPLLNILNEGITPKKLALSVMLGFVFGIFPIIGITTILCALVALIFRLNMLAIQIVNYFVYPLQLILFVPYLKIGTVIFHLEHLLSFRNFSEITSFADILIVFKDLYLVFLGAILIWFVFALVGGFIIFRILYTFFRSKIFAKKYNL